MNMIQLKQTSASSQEWSKLSCHISTGTHEKHSVLDISHYNHWLFFKYIKRIFPVKAVTSANVNGALNIKNFKFT